MSSVYKIGSNLMRFGGGMGSAPAEESMQLVSRSLPVYANTGTAANAISSDYTTYWQSSGTPGIVSIDISSLTEAQKLSMCLVMIGDVSDGYDAAYATANSLADDYTIETNTAAGGSLPGSGWVTAATVTNNTFKHRQHILPLTGKNWVRFNATTSSAATVKAKFDLYSSTGFVGRKHGILTIGDSITHQSFDYAANGSEGNLSFSEQVAALVGKYVPQSNGGQPGWSAATYTGGGFAVLDGWLAAHPTRYVSVTLGTNDANNATDYRNNMIAIAEHIVTSGAIPIINRVPYSTDGAHAHMSTLNAEIPTIVAAVPSAIIGVDYYTLFTTNSAMLSDGIHPNDELRAITRAALAEFVAGLL